MLGVRTWHSALDLLAIPSLSFLLVYRFLKLFLGTRRLELRVGRLVTLDRLQSSLVLETPEELRLRAARDKQQRALVDFFGSTDRSVAADLRVLRSAAFLSSEIDSILHHEDEDVGWRRYNRFFAAGTEEFFTNVPAGRSPLVVRASSLPTTIQRELVRAVPGAFLQSSGAERAGTGGQPLQQAPSSAVAAAAAAAARYGTKLEGEVLSDAEVGLVLAEQQQQYQQRQRTQTAV